MRKVLIFIILIVLLSCKTITLKEEQYKKLKENHHSVFIFGNEYFIDDNGEIEYFCK